MFSGLYINLDRRPERRAHMEKELARFGLSGRYRCLRAIADPDPGLGCFRSHLKALDEARRIGGIVHILEDDSILSANLAPFLVSEECAAFLEQHDILFLDMWIDAYKAVVDRYQAVIDEGRPALIFAGDVRIGCTSSYVIAPRSFGKIRRLWRRHLNDEIAIDVLCDRLVKDGTISAAVPVPFLTGVDLGYGAASDIQFLLPRDEQRKLAMLRTRFFIDRERQPFL